MNPSDGELVDRARAGDASAFHELVRRHRSMARSAAVHLVGRPDAVDDLVQEGFLQAWTSLGRLADGDRFRGWLYGILLNLSRRWLVTRESPLDDYWEGDPVDPFASIEARWLVREAVRQLPPGSREAVVLYYFDDLTVEQVAASLGLSASAVKLRLHRGRLQLRGRLAEEFPRRQRRPAMTPVRIAMIVPAAPRLLVVLHDEDGGRILPLWLPPRAMVGKAAGLAARVLAATGTALEAVHVAGPEKAELRLRTGDGTTTLPVEVAEGLALAHRWGCPVLVGEELIGERGVSLRGTSIEEAVAALTREAGLPAPAVRAAEPRVAEPRNMDFSEGLRFWDLRGSFLHDTGGAHWRDYSCEAHGGEAWLRSAVERPLGFADLRQAVLAEPYHGRRVRLRALVRGTGGGAALYLRIVGEDRTGGPEAGRLTSAPEDEGGWERLVVETEVPPDAVFLLFGVTLRGEGAVGVREADFGTVTS
ncbi:hypothetical protein GCM10009530_39580 [Microbispora corallina]|uniref:Sigma-70 family RNA polymerase sigma factor n=1 Tax=Microbispora corallina TaxID=83302 RepID=A0ABQ4G8R0_9ACTN|nr:sigma-70 family RNA polymerase sigma factor [Microbispora corallina]GIH43431.1 hypothetical protein Mco01_64310 [Microbispora corallina]